jgi:hypothetical protein
MPKQTRYLDGLLFCLCCLCCQLAGSASAEPAAAAPAPAAVQSHETLRAALASGKPTPLDALTPYGKREAIRQMRWNENGLSSFGNAPLIRDLGHEQLSAVLHFIGAGDYLPMLDKRLIGPPLRLPAPSGQVEEDLQLLRQFAEADAKRRAAASASTTGIGAPAVLRRYHQLFEKRLSAAGLHAAPLGDLVPLFDAAKLAANDNPASPALQDMLRVHQELSARGIDTRRTLDDGVLYALLAARRFNDARAFAAIRPGLADVAIPEVMDSLGPGFKGRSAFAYDAARNTLTRVALPAQTGTELVMVVSAACHNSNNALQAIRDDPALQARLREAHLVLVTAPNAPVETDLIGEWNAANPSMPIHAPYSAGEWRGIDVTGVPAFYLLRNGKVIGQRAGWPDDGKARLLQLIDANK